MIRYHACGCAIWVQKIWDGVKHSRVYYDPVTKKHITQCPQCGAALRGAVLHIKVPPKPESDWDWLWARLRDELGEERALQLHAELRNRQQNTDDN